MVQGLVGKVAKAVLKLILPDVTEHLLRVFKLKKLIDYVELPNEADRKVEKLEKQHELVTSKLKELEDITSKIKKLRAFKSIG
mgnify:CR=1 FL=1